MDELKEHTIPFSGLKDGTYQHRFQLGKDFFLCADTDGFQGGLVTADVTLDKQPTLLVANIHVDGTVSLSCDHCDGPLDLPVQGDQRQIFQLNAEADQGDEELIGLEAGAHSVNLTQYFYECIRFALPVRRIHPKGKCDPEVDAVLRKLAIEHEPIPDPRWEALKGLKNQRP